ncbi:MAG: hypothetical protein QM800_10510 [Paludibacter sp.]
MFNCWSLLHIDNAEMLLDQGEMLLVCAEIGQGQGEIVFGRAKMPQAHAEIGQRAGEKTVGRAKMALVHAEMAESLGLCHFSLLLFCFRRLFPD